MFKTLPNIQVTNSQMEYLKARKKRTGSAYAVIVRFLIQEAMDESNLELKDLSKAVDNEMV